MDKWGELRRLNDDYIHSKIILNAGDVVSVNVLGQRTVYLGSLQVAHDLLETRGTKYSDRPKSVVGAMVGYYRTVPMVCYGETLKLVRRMFTKAVGTRALMEDFMPLMSRTVQDFAWNLLQSPQDFSEHVRL